MGSMTRLPQGYVIDHLKTSDLGAIAEVNALAFGSRIETINMARLKARLNLALSRVIRHGGRVVGAMVVSNRRMRKPSQEWADVAGVSWVAVHPDHQLRGLFEALADSCLQAISDSGQFAVIAAYASRQDAYFGREFAVAARSAQASFRGRMRLPRSSHHVTSSTLSSHHLSQLAALHAQFEGPAGQFAVIEQDLAEWCDPMYLASGDPAPALIEVADDKGEVVGAAVTQFRDKSDNEARMWVMDLVAQDPGARASLWRYLNSAAIGRSTVTPPLAMDSPELLWIKNYRRDRVLLRAGLQLRIVDVESALCHRGYAAPLPPTSFHVYREGGRRPECFTLAVDSSGTAEFGAAPRQRADVECSLRELAATYLGAISWFSLGSAGLVSFRTDEIATRLDRSFCSKIIPHANWDF
ncbi:GNAT family N-acetyltransferase [Cellulomonas bogoriensis]|uniref:GNAT family N-acetyltransferase n=1 Tax=Cellulomonas bogoriensis TaxID=301388 RepID=UPI0018DDAC13|nr:GNAT family N-acetyltransferase [Cellulomonas bogoriensis]